MSVNHYFQHGMGIGSESEQNLHEDIIVESLKIFGHDVYYLPRKLVNHDLVLGEDVLSRFDHSYLVEMYMETTEGFQGEQELISKFGLEIREDTTFVVAKRRWQWQVDNPATQITEGRPNEGDLIFFPLMNSFFEIQFVEDQQPFFQLGNLPIYKLRCTRFEYSGERIRTGNAAMDQAETKYSLDILQWKTLLEDNSGALVLETSSASESHHIISDEYQYEEQTRQYADNETFEADAGFGTETTTDDIIDFSELNPFGDPKDPEGFL